MGKSLSKTFVRRTAAACRNCQSTCPKAGITPAPRADFSLRPGAYYGGDTGNIFAVLDGELEGDPVIFCAHMDVVEPWSGKKSVLEKDGTIHSAGDTVLGADDISGILEILYCVQLVLDSGKPHKKIEILFTIGEEL